MIESRRDLEAYAAQLEQSNERLRGFAQMLAHEVKAPLATVAGCLAMLDQRYGGGLDEEAKAFCRDADVAVRGMSDLVTMLLQFARFESRAQVFHDVDLESVFYQAYALLREAIREAGAALTHDPLPIVRGDESQLRQLLQNLISNAIKYRSGRPPQIHVSAAEDDGQWTFSVSDNGRGVPLEHQQRIFEMFVRLPSAEKIPGSGIGLSFCKLIVESHGGRIWLQSALDQGATFRFTLPKRLAAPVVRNESPADDFTETAGVPIG